MQDETPIKLSELTMEESKGHICPEYILWLAVIDRAISDLCSPAQELTPLYAADLHSFFWEDTPRQYNLVYICSMLLDREDAVAKIRHRIKTIGRTKKPQSYRSSRT
jgi:hypothetical protein